MRTLALAFTALLTAGSLTAGLFDDCDHRATRDASTPAAGISRVVVRALSGDLRITGRPGANAVRAHGIACASSASLLAQSNVILSRRGSELLVVVQLPEEKGWLGQASLDLEVELPDSIPVTLEDSSGDTNVQGIASLDAHDSSGDFVVRDVRGDVLLHDSSGDIDIEQVGGNVNVTDSSGDMTIERVAGSVLIPDDSSGDITVNGVRHDVTVDNDSSGDIDVADIGGNFTVRDDGSGGVYFARVQGKVSVPKS